MEVTPGVNIRGSVSWDLFWIQVYDAMNYGDIVSPLLRLFLRFAIA